MPDYIFWVHRMVKIQNNCHWHWRELLEKDFLVEVIASQYTNAGHATLKYLGIVVGCVWLGMFPVYKIEKHERHNF